MCGESKMTKIIMCDDDRKFIEQFEKLILKYFKNSHREVIIERYYSAEEFILSDTKMIDIAFLDVEMKDINGIQLGYEIQKQCPNAVLFIITSYSQYLDEAMDLKVFRYLEKPVDEKRLFRGLDIVLQEKQKISFISNNVETEMTEDEIVCVYTSLRKTSVLTDKGETVTSKTTMKEWQKKLSVCNSFSSIRMFPVEYRASASCSQSFHCSSGTRPRCCQLFSVTLSCKYAIAVGRIFPLQITILSFKSIMRASKKQTLFLQRGKAGTQYDNPTGNMFCKNKKRDRAICPIYFSTLNKKTKLKMYFYC